MIQLSLLPVIFVGGGMGATLRFVMSGLITHRVASLFPWGTLAVNLLGAFLIGMIVELSALKLNMSETARALFVTGFLGGFTTFSAFSLEASSMIQRHDYMACAAYILLSVCGTIALVFTAMHMTRHFL